MTKRASPPNGCLVIYGLGEDRRPHAARFSSADDKSARKAAGLMGLHIARADTEATKALAKQLPAGRMFATGRALVPFVRQAIYDQLIVRLKPFADAVPDKAASPEAASTPAAVAAPKPVATTTDAKQALRNTVLIGVPADERQQLLNLWPAKDRTVPDFCARLAAIWDEVWLPPVQRSFGDRARPFAYTDFEKREIEYFVPTVFKCWQQRWIWGVWAINGRWQLWSGLQCSTDNRSVALLFDLTTQVGERHANLEAAIAREYWQLKSARNYSALVTRPFPIPPLVNPSAPELKQLGSVAEGAIAASAKLLNQTARAVPHKNRTTGARWQRTKPTR